MQSSTISAVGAALARVIVSAKGSYVTDEDGRSYLDLAMGMGSCFLGHNPPEIVEPIQQNIKDFVVGQFLNVHRERLLSALQGFIPPDLDHVLLFNTGGEAVEAALQIARRFTGCMGIVRFKGCFHGKTYLTTSLDTTGFRERIGISPWDDNVALLPGQVADKKGVERHTIGLGEAVERLERLVSERKHHLGAVIVEPIQGSGNVEIPLEFLQKLREISMREGLLLIADEVVSGFGRSGEPFAFTAAGILPDVVTGGKAISSGYPIGVSILSSSLAKETGINEAGMTSTTFGGNSLSCMAASLTSEIILKERLWERAQAVGEYFHRELEGLVASEDSIRAVSGRGLMLGVELDERLCSSECSRKLCQMLVDRNIICPISGGRIRLLPSVWLSRKEIDHFIESLRGAVQQIVV